MTLQLLHFGFSYIWGKFDFLFISACSPTLFPLWVLFLLTLFCLFSLFQNSCLAILSSPLPLASLYACSKASWVFEFVPLHCSFNFLLGHYNSFPSHAYSALSFFSLGPLLFLFLFSIYIHPSFLWVLFLLFCNSSFIKIPCSNAHCSLFSHPFLFSLSHHFFFLSLPFCEFIVSNNRWENKCVH